MLSVIFTLWLVVKSHDFIQIWFLFSVGIKKNSFRFLFLTFWRAWILVNVVPVKDRTLTHWLGIRFFLSLNISCQRTGKKNAQRKSDDLDLYIFRVFNNVIATTKGKRVVLNLKTLKHTFPWYINGMHPKMFSDQLLQLCCIWCLLKWTGQRPDLNQVWIVNRVVS